MPFMPGLAPSTFAAMSATCCQVGAGATLAGCVLGEGAAVPAGAVLEGEKVSVRARG
jgi:carbonic anhydrase/acetyltransferase-like protein (isoleucine patch superfamily)